MSQSKLNFSGKSWLDTAQESTKFLFRIFCSGDVIPLSYTCGTIEGIYNETPDGKDIIAIDNTNPHNGDFDKFLDQLEQYAKDTGQRIAICAFMNERLYHHIRKRKGWGNVMSTMDRLEYYPKDAECLDAE